MAELGVVRRRYPSRVNAHKSTLDAALRELVAWRGQHHASDTTTEQTYDIIQKYLSQAAQLHDDAAFYDHLSSINRFVCDQGPLSEDFIPSFKRLFLNLHRIRQPK